MSTPKQIDDVVGVDGMDTIDRQKLDPRIKLQLLMAECQATHGRDPRSGGFAIVGRPRVILQLMLDMRVAAFSSDIRLERPVIIGARGGDVIGWWRDVPVVVRCTVVDDRLWCVPASALPESQLIDRRQAGIIRMNAHRGTLDTIREEEN